MPVPDQSTAVRPRKAAEGTCGTENPTGERCDGAGRRLAEQFVEDVLKDWEAHGAAAIAAVRAERPHEFLKLVTGLLPKGTDAKEDRLEELTDEQLAGQLAAALARLAEAGAGPRRGD